MIKLKFTKVPDQTFLNLFLEFYRLKAIIDSKEEHNKIYVIIRLVTIIEQLCRFAMKSQYEKNKTPLPFNIEVNLSMIDHIINFSTERKTKITKELIASLSRSVQNTQTIRETMNTLDRKKLQLSETETKEFDKLFEARHILVHTVTKPQLSDIKLYYELTEDLIKRIFDKITGIPWRFYFAKGFAFQKLGMEYKQRFTKSKHNLEKIIEKDPNNISTYIDNEKILLDQNAYEKLMGYFKKSIECFDEAIRLNSEYWGYMGKGISLSELEKQEEAIVCFDEAIKFNLDDDVYIYKGIALQGLEKHEEAIGCFDEAIKLNSKNYLTYHFKGISLQRLGRIEEARENIEKGQKLHDS